MRLPKCYQLNDECVVTAYGLDVHFILQLTNRFISDDLINKTEERLIDHFIIISVWMFTWDLSRTFNACSLRSFRSTTRYTVPNAPDAITPQNSYFSFKYSRLMSLNWGENSNTIVGVGQMLRLWAANSSGERVDVDLKWWKWTITIRSNGWWL